MPVSTTLTQPPDRQVNTRTVRSLLDWAVERLRLTPTQSPRLDAEVLLSHCTHRTRTQLMGWPQFEVNPPYAEAFGALIEARETGIPVAYLVGHREFMDLQFQVGPGALVPRPETELLVEWAIRYLDTADSAWNRTLIDVGTGPGTILLSLASHVSTTGTKFVGSDCSSEALAWANRNRLELVPGEHVHLVRGDLLTWFGGKASLVVANLPYLRPDQVDDNWEVTAEPRTALDGGAAGLDLITQLIRSLPDKLEPQGAAAVEIDPSQSAAVVELLQKNLPWLNADVHQDLAGLNRFVTAS